MPTKKTDLPFYLTEMHFEKLVKQVSMTVQKVSIITYYNNNYKRLWYK